jgi:hypothetical protein
MNALKVYVNGVGLCGPGLADWPAARDVFTGNAAYQRTRTALRAPEALPPAERRRVGSAIKLSMGIGFEAVRNTGADAAKLATVFSSTGGDCDNCHALTEALASEDRQVSPTRFHNSVHNAPSGYWSIATGCMAASTSLCAYDGTFGAALLESAAQVASGGEDHLLIAYDTAYPEPLYRCRPLIDAFGVAMVLSAEPREGTLGALTISLVGEQPTPLEDEALEALRVGVPAARALPLLRAMARNESGRTVLEYLDNQSLSVEYSA